jgi:hypothetical protein
VIEKRRGHLNQVNISPMPASKLNYIFKKKNLQFVN